MLIWLASYPRSGNTLLRSVLNETMGLKSATRYGDRAGSELLDQLSGFIDIDQPFPDFYEWACHTKETVFVKTHELPSDNNRAVYVVRDGRATLTSFLKFERDLNQTTQSMLSLILGNHHFGSWSNHYEQWVNRDTAETLVLKYDALLNASPPLLSELASFVGYTGPKKQWKTSVDKLKETDPLLVNDAFADFIPSEDWDAACDLAFWSLHGQLMEKLQLAKSEQRQQLSAQTILELLKQILMSSSQDTISLMESVVEKENVIQLQAKALESLLTDCHEKQALIERQHNMIAAHESSKQSHKTKR